ncbi:sporulation kinase A [bacterium BMS3Bbin06]|nr:sporulation kinase A [bacterium BMS3Abin08]GBE34229.1 sporulation kinase A [bacterium BMS3Bbin06]HDO36911.1 sensor histidine kinase [Nitrospirota bacterium]HDY71990.1 sensor histidine kinase [Nitrospirota bacterium]
MAKRLSIYIGILGTIIFIITTSVYYFQTRRALLQEMYSQGGLIVDENKKSINNFLNGLRNITSAIYQDGDIKAFLEGDIKKRHIIEERFLGLQQSIPLIQAIRVLNTGGDILIFVRELSNLSGADEYRPICLKGKSFYKKAFKLKKPVMLFSNFERGQLPDTEKFCPAMIRTIIPYFSAGKKIGFLIVNFWGSAIDTAITNIIGDEKAYSFLVELNTVDKERDGIFVFHKKKTYEFANQYGTDYRFSTIYGKNTETYLRNRESGLYKIKGKNDFLIFTTIYPYNNKEQVWKVCTVVSGDYFYRNLYALKKNFLFIMFIAIVMSIITGVAFSRRFVRPFRTIKDALQRYGNGDLDYRFKVKGDYEVNEIAGNIQKMATSLKNYLQELTISRKKLDTMDRLSSLAIISAGLSHELNTPLNSIILLSRMLYEETDEHLREDISTIREQALRCVNILNDLKRISPIWNQNGNVSEINLKDVVLKLKPLFELSDKGVNISYDLRDCLIKGKEIHFEQVVLNLTLNAMDACKSGCKIIISVFSEGNRAVLRVSDNGSGIPEKDIHRIFDPFYTTKSPDRGTGLGLSIVENIVKRYGGIIKVDSPAERGTTIEISFEENGDEGPAY